MFRTITTIYVLKNFEILKSLEKLDIRIDSSWVSIIVYLSSGKKKTIYQFNFVLYYLWYTIRIVWTKTNIMSKIVRETESARLEIDVIDQYRQPAKSSDRLDPITAALLIEYEISEGQTN